MSLGGGKTGQGIERGRERERGNPPYRAEAGGGCWGED